VAQGTKKFNCRFVVQRLGGSLALPYLETAMRQARLTAAWVAFAMAIMLKQTHGAEAGYDPLSKTGEAEAPIDLTVHDAKRERDIPIRVYLPETAAGAIEAPAPVVMFSHGLGGSRENSPYLGRHWAARGYAVVCLQHAGSDEAVWRGKRFAERMESMRAAMTADNLLLRAQDVHAALDQLTGWSVEAGHALFGRLDLDHIGMCGHSFGAGTTQAVGGQKFLMTGTSNADERIKAAVMFSPSSPRRGLTAAQSFGEVKIPWMLMTGTLDVAPVGDQTLESRLAVYPALPAGSKYEVVLEGAQHSAFGDRVLMGERLERNPNHHRVILALSTAFWDSYLRDNAAARAWLDGDGPKSVLQEKDRWQKK
jgi:dienelactone hydrolase